MSGHTFLKAAIEQLNEGGLIPQAGQAVAPTVNVSGAGDEAPLVEELQNENEQLSQELIVAEGENDQAFTEKVSGQIDGLTEAIEALGTLEMIVGDAIRQRKHSPHANAGYSLALESISSNAGFPGAALAAANEAVAVGGENPTEEQKAGGVFSGIREKIKKIWEYLVQLSKRIITSVKTGAYFSQVSSLLVGLDADCTRLLNIDEASTRGTINDEALCKALRIPKNEKIGATVQRTSHMIAGFMGYTREFNKMGAEAIKSVENPTEMSREKVITGMTRLSTQMATIIKKGASDTDTHVESGPTLCGINVKLDREFVDGKLPKINVSYTVDDKDYANELDMAGRFDAQLAQKFFTYLNEYGAASGGTPLDAIAAEAEKLKATVPSSWANLDNIQDVQEYASASMGLVAKHLLQLQQIVLGHLVVRTLWAISKWFRVTLETIEKGDDKAPEAGGQPAAA